MDNFTDLMRKITVLFGYRHIESLDFRTVGKQAETGNPFFFASFGGGGFLRLADHSTETDHQLILGESGDDPMFFYGSTSLAQILAYRPKVPFDKLPFAVPDPALPWDTVLTVYGANEIGRGILYREDYRISRPPTLERTSE